MTLSNPVSGNAPGLPTSNSNAVIAGLMMALADAELVDRDLARLEGRARREAKQRARDVWHAAYMKEQVARHTYLSFSYLRSALIHGPSTEAEKGAASAEEDIARRLWVQAIDALMRVPAPHVRGLRWKQEHAHLRANWRTALYSGKAKEPNPEWVALIAADEARLLRVRSP